MTPAYFSTVGLAVRRGRTFTAGDRDEVVVVNEAFLARLPDPMQPLGSLVRLGLPAGSAQFAQIIGVVDNGYERMPSGQARPRCYVPLDPAAAGDFSIFARSPLAATLEPHVERILGRIDPRLAPRDIGTVAALIRSRYNWLYWITEALAAVSVIALVLSAVGLFALMSYSVSQRTSEFGIRIALGAHPSRIALGVLRQSLGLTLAGTIAGVAAALPIAAVLGDAVLATISWRDPGPLAAVTTVLFVVAAIATLSPTSRAWRVDPVETLRMD